MKHRSPRPVRAAKVSYTVISLLFCALGIVLMAVPEFSVPWIGRLLGVGMIVFGAIKLLGYFSRDLFRLAFQYDLAFGVLLIALAVDSRRFGLPRWWLVMALALLTCAAGVLLVVRPGTGARLLTVLMGLSLLLDGVLNLIVALCTVKVARNQRPDVIDAEED